MGIIKRYREGMTLVELIVYIGVVVLVLVAVVSVVLFITRSLSDLRASRDIRNSAVTVLERVGREIRQAESIGASTVFDTTLGQLELNTGSTPATVLFKVTDGSVELYENGIYVGDLSLSTATVTAMTFTEITTASSKGVRVEITFENVNPAHGPATTFYTTGILRGSYDD